MMAAENHGEAKCGPLAGLRVVELSSTVAGPFCGRLLADFGAEVIKIEPPEGDALRSMGERLNGSSLYAASILRNKRLIALDMRRVEAQEIVRKLVGQADIFIENFRPGTIEKWGLGYDELASANVGLVMVRISGYGQSGPYSGYPGYGATSEAMSGLRDLTGDPDRPPARVATSLTDYITGLYAAFGAVLAIAERNTSGRGQVVDAALYESAFSFVEPHIPAFSALGRVAQRAGTRLPGHAPNNLYQTADGQQIQIVAASDGIFQRLLTAMDQDELALDSRFSSPERRAEHSDDIDAIISYWTRSRTTEELQRALVAAGVPVAPIYNVADIFSDPHYRARGMLLSVTTEASGEIVVPGVVPKLSRTPGDVTWAGKGIGRDTCQILSDFLGLSSEEISEMRSAGFVV